jgi:hypothetical protein
LHFSKGLFFVDFITLNPVNSLRSAQDDKVGRFYSNKRALFFLHIFYLRLFATFFVVDLISSVIVTRQGVETVCCRIRGLFIAVKPPTLYFALSTLSSCTKIEKILSNKINIKQLFAKLLVILRQPHKWNRLRLDGIR